MSKSGSVLPKASARSIIHNFISKQEKCGEKYRNFQFRSLLLHVDNNYVSKKKKTVEFLTRLDNTKCKISKGKDSDVLK